MRLRYQPRMDGVNAAWLALLLAGVFEIAWAYGLKHSDGFTHFWPTLGTVTAITASYILMGFSLKAIPFGTAYAIWAGIGVAGTAMLGILAFGEPADIPRLLCLALVATGIVGLKLAGPG